MKLMWATDYWAEGNAYGYSVHNRMMKEHLSKMVEFSDDAPIALTVLNPENYEPIPNKFNALFTMFEMEDLPERWIERINKADFLIVPCEHNKKLFRRYTDLPIEVCHEGADVDRFTYVKREYPFHNGKKFRFLWVGAPNPRKGYEEMALICEALKDLKEIEIYLKTSVSNKIETRGNVIFDSRNIPIDELVKLYHSAHAFILPSRGEGWGLTLTEAMATGLPCIAPKHTGMADFFDDYVGYTVRWSLRPVDLLVYDLKTTCPFPDVPDIISRMKEIIANYKEALQKGKKAAERIRNRYTWPKAAERLVEILKNIKGV